MKKNIPLQWSEHQAPEPDRQWRIPLGTRILPLLFAIALPAFAPAQEEPPPPLSEAERPFDDFLLMDAVVVTANKFPRRGSETGSSVSVLHGEDLETRQVRSLENALKLAPGIILTSSGVRGSNSSIFLRGANSNQTQFVVDGIRVTDSNILPNPFLGGEGVHNLGRIEILRGPQSALYGSEAIGGVVSLFTRRGEGPPAFRVHGGAGSFDSVFGGIEGEGELDELAYSFSFRGESTANDRLNNDFEQLESSARLDFDLDEDTALAFTLRQAHREFGSPGSTFINSPDNRETDSTLLVTSRLEKRVNDTWSSNLTLGALSQKLDFVTSTAATGIDSRKIAGDWRNIFELSDRHVSLLGVAAERTAVKNTGFGAIDDTEYFISLYAQHTVNVTEALSLTGGLRREDYDSFGDAWTHRATASYDIAQTGTRLHASYGTGFRAPSFFELFAVNPFFVGNRTLDPERSRGWDAGVEQRIGENHTLGVTGFHNRIEDLITTDFSVFPSTVVNSEEATTRGIEVFLNGKIGDSTAYSVAYTFLEAENDSTGRRLLRRPRHTLGFDIQKQLCESVLVGFGGHLVNDRHDIDAATFATIDGDDYFVARVYGNVALDDGVDLHLRVENAFDESYDEVSGFPGLGLAVYGGITIEF